MLFALLQVIRQLVSLIFVQESPEVSLVEFCSQAQQHFAGQRSLSLEEWNSSLPSEMEKQEMARLVTRIYSLTDFDSFDISLKDFPALENKINITRIKNYCVIHEPFPSKGVLFPRNWGLLAIADPRVSTRILHHSAVHFDSEGPIYEEAARVCQDTKSRSLALHGASRYAITPPANSTCQKKYFASDGAHNANTMFHLWSTTLLNLSKWRNEDFTFIQWHGMAETSCSADVFVSMGSKSPSVYASATSAARLAESFNSRSEGLECSTPGSDSKCRLVASDNPLGRLINGVSPTQVCSTKAQDKDIHGQFLHIEQKSRPREAQELWVAVIEEVFQEEKRTVYSERRKTELF